MKYGDLRTSWINQSRFRSRRATPKQKRLWGALTGFGVGEIESLVGATPGEDVWGAAMGALPDGDRAPFQQMTFTLHDEQAEAVNAAMARARDMGPFVDSPNENSNGNALARVCETFLTDHGHG